MNAKLILLVLALISLVACGDSESKVCAPTTLPQVCVPSNNPCCSSTINVPFCRDGAWTCAPGQVIGSCQAVGGTLPRCGPAPDASPGNH